MLLNTNVCVPHSWSGIDSPLGTVQQNGIHLKSQFQPRSCSFSIGISPKNCAHIPLKGRREGKRLQIHSEDELQRGGGR